MRLLGVDTGGTFTDFVVLEGQQLKVHKVLSTPQAPEQAILQGICELGLASGSLQVVHGSTVATNAVLEGKGVATAFITNRGLRDLLTIGRQARRELYNLQPEPVKPPVPRELCLETGGRLGADGTVVEPLTQEDLTALRTALDDLAPAAVAINLLFAFLDDRFERQIEAVMPAGVFVSRSSDVLPEYREYERGMATWLNAYVGPLLEGYLARLGEGVAPASVAVMQSAGNTIDAAQAGRNGVHMLLSGPAGGVMAARYIGRTAECERLLTFDMGGTSTDVALIDGEVRLTTEGAIGEYPVAVPMVDMHTIGAGGGSIAYVDAGGLLQVGPQSAGADPGPACYGRGGEAPTVTDANLVLGRLRPDAFLGGGMALDVAAARAAVGRVAKRLGRGVEAAAEGIVRIANEHMAGALRVISVQRGLDPQGFVLMSFGGAGGLHVCALAEIMGMRKAIVPVHAGVLSALGMLVAPRGRQLSRTVGAPLERVDAEALAPYFDELIAQGRESLVHEGVAPGEIITRRSLDLRYLGQAYTLNVPWRDDMPAATQAFHYAHKDRYGHSLEEAVELVNIRVALRGPDPDVRLAPLSKVQSGADIPVKLVSLYGIGDSVPVYPRAELRAGQVIGGPALVTETVSTTFIAPAWRCEVDGVGNLLLQRG